MNTSSNPERNTSQDYTSRFRCGAEVGYTTQKWFNEALRKCCDAYGERIDIMNFIPQYSYGVVVSVKFHKPIGSRETFVFYDIKDKYTNVIETDIPSDRVKQVPENQDKTEYITYLL